MKVLILTAAAMLSGCVSATMVNTRGDSASQYAPVNEKSNPGGVVKYLNQGAKSVRKSRREAAYKQMYEYCNGAYQIASEGERLQDGASMVIPAAFPGVIHDQEKWWYIDFECETRN
jgi:hypothetical protein